VKELCALKKSTLYALRNEKKEYPLSTENLLFESPLSTEKRKKSTLYALRYFNV